MFLQTAAASAAAAMVASRGRATGSNDLVTWRPAGGWGSFGMPRRILEIFLRGAASPWSSFWYDETLGGSGQFGTRDTTLSDDAWRDITWDGLPVTHSWQGGTIGKAAGPLFRTVGASNRKLADHMRVLRVGHRLGAHEVAIPYAATGTTLGRPKAAGLGAACGRRRVEALGGTPPAVPGPKSLVLQAGSEAGDIRAANACAQFGFHGAEYRPPVIKVGESRFFDALDSRLHPVDAMHDRTDSDDLKRFFRNRYGSKMMIGTEQARSEGWDGYQASFDMLIDDYQALYNLLGAPDIHDLLFTPVSAPTYHGPNLTRNAIEAAIKLLKDSQYNEMQHIAVIDGGVITDYDTHDPDPSLGTSAKIQNGNIWNVCDTLALHLSDILDHGIAVLIHSEFGRIEKKKGDRGTDHHTDGYANVVISDLACPGFAGWYEADHHENAAFTGDLGHLTPTDVHAAVAQLAGIDPWQTDMYDADLAGTTQGGLVDEDVGDHLLEIWRALQS